MPVGMDRGQCQTGGVAIGIAAGEKDLEKVFSEMSNLRFLDDSCEA